MWHTSRFRALLIICQAFIITHPEQARILLQKQPQLSYALFQALLLHKIVPTEVLHKMRDASTSSMQDVKRHPLPPPSRAPVAAVPPSHMQPPPPHAYAQPPTMPPYMPPTMPTPPPNSMYAQPSPQMPPAAQPYYRPPPPAMPPQPASAPPAQAPDVSEQQRVH